MEIRKNKGKSRLALLLILVLTAALLAGCRESDAIQRVVYTQDAEDVDPEHVISNPKLQSEVDQYASKIQEDNAANHTEQELSGQETQDAENDIKTPQEGEANGSANDANQSNQDDLQHSSQTGDSLSKTSQNDGFKGNQNNNDNNNDSSHYVDGEEPQTDELPTEPHTDELPTEEDEQPETESQEEPTTEEKPDDTQKKDDSDDNTGRRKAGDLEDDPNSRPIYDDEGNIITLPEHVRSVVAPGNAGLIVQMLGGQYDAEDGSRKTVLQGTSEDFLSNSMAQSVFADEGFSDIAKLWDGDGSEPMTEADFDYLINDLYPDCVVAINGQANFTADQLEQLQQVDIPVVYIPGMTSAYNIEQSVKIIGTALDDNTSSGGLNSLQISFDYVNWVIQTTNRIAGYNGIHSYYGMDLYGSTQFFRSGGAYKTKNTYTVEGGKGTMYIDGWDDEKYYIVNDTFDQHGMAYIKNHQNAVLPLSYYLSIAGVIDAATFKRSDTNADYIYPFAETVEDPSTEENNWFVKQTNIPVGINPFTTSGGWDLLMIPLFELTNDQGGRSHPEHYLGYLGEDSYNKILVNNNYTKEKIETSKADAWGLYRPAEIIRERGLPYLIDKARDPEKGTPIGWVQYVLGDYEVLVNPKGVGSWTEGSPESILESVWASEQFFGTGNAQNAIDDFYQTFYRHSLSAEDWEDLYNGDD